jgi:hypothetical protein
VLPLRQLAQCTRVSQSFTKTDLPGSIKAMSRSETVSFICSYLKYKKKYDFNVDLWDTRTQFRGHSKLGQMFHTYFQFPTDGSTIKYSNPNFTRRISESLKCLRNGSLYQNMVRNYIALGLRTCVPTHPFISRIFNAGQRQVVSLLLVSFA